MHRLPLFPLGTTVFPGRVLPLHVFEPRYRELVRVLMDEPVSDLRQFGVIALRRGVEAGNDSPEIYDIGCAVRLRQVMGYPDGRYDIVTVGTQRFRLQRLIDEETPYLMADVDVLEDPAGAPAEELALLAERVRAQYLRYARAMAGSPTSVTAPKPSGLPADPRQLSYAVASHTELSTADRQSLLASLEVYDRLGTELRMLLREVELITRLSAVPTTAQSLALDLSPN